MFSRNLSSSSMIWTNENKTKNKKKTKPKHFVEFVELETFWGLANQNNIKEIQKKYQNKMNNIQ